MYVSLSKPIRIMDVKEKLLLNFYVFFATVRKKYGLNILSPYRLNLFQRDEIILLYPPLEKGDIY